MRVSSHCHRQICRCCSWAVVALIGCWPISAQDASKLRPDLLHATDPPPRDSLSYTDYPGTAIYIVSIQIGVDKQAEVYKGMVRCHFNERRHWRIDASLSKEKSDTQTASPTFGFNRLPSFARNHSGYLETFDGVEAQFHLDAMGKIEHQSDDQQMNLFLGDFMTLPILQLPADAKRKWTLEKPVMVERVSGAIPGLRLPMRFGGIGGLAYSQGLAAGIEKSQFSIKTISPAIETIEHTYMLDASQLEPPAKVTGRGISQFDRKRGTFIEHVFDRTIVTQHSGAETTIPVHVEVRLESDSGLLPWTDQQRAEIAEAKRYAASPEGIAEAERIAAEKKKRQLEIEADRLRRVAMRQAEADQEMEPARRQAWIAIFSAGTEYGDAAHALGKLRGVSDREDPELAAAILGFANRMRNGSLATQFYDLAAKFDPKFATVKDLRLKLCHSFNEISPPGPAIESSNELSEGQLILFNVKHRGFCPHVVTDISADGVLIRPVDRDSVLAERIRATLLRLPPPEVTPYLGDTLAGTRLASPPAARPTDRPTDNEPVFDEWSDRSGRYQLQAQLISFDDPKVRLKNRDGQLVEIDITQLDEAGAKRVRDWVDAKNPFQVIHP